MLPDRERRVLNVRECIQIEGRDWIPQYLITKLRCHPLAGRSSRRSAIFFGSASCQRASLVASSNRVRTAPVSSVDGCVRITDRARHPSGSSVGPSEACALAAWPPQKNLGTVPYPNDFHRTVVAGRPASIS